MIARIRLAREADAEAVAAIYRPFVESTPVSFEIEPPDRHEIARRIAATLPCYPWLVCDVGGEVAGYAYAGRHAARAAYRWSVDVSVYIAEAHRRRGVGHGLYRSLLAILAAQGYATAYAGVTLPNPASVGLHESMGFTPVGVYARAGYKQDGWYDVGWWQLAIGGYPDAPQEPRELGDVQGRAGWDALLAAGEAVIRARQP